jgi:hypothetical protein
MKLRPKRILASASAVLVAGGVVIATAGSAFAVTPGWEPDPNSVGSITFTDSTGAPITGGSLTAPISAYVIASVAGRASDTKATLYGASPVQGENPGLWSSEKMSASTTYNPSGTIPADLAGTGLPVVSAPSETVGTLIQDLPNASTVSGYQNLYEIRLFTSGTQAPASTYDSADIQVSNVTTDGTGTVTGGTWAIVYPPATDATTTTISETPPNPDITSANPVTVTLNASVSAAAPGVPGTYTGPIGAVQFFDGATQVGPTELVTGTGPYTASFADTGVANPSTHSFKAVFSPFEGTTLIGSPSAVSPWQAELPADSTNTTLGATWGTYAGNSNTFTGTVTDTTHPATIVTTGTVNLFDNGSVSPLNPTPLALSGTGGFTYTNTFATAGPHSVVAVYSGVSGTYLTSSSQPVTDTQGVAPGNPCDPSVGGQCTDTQTITGKIPTGVLSISTPYTATAPLNLGTLALDPTDTYFTANKQFGNSTTDPTQDILITDTRAGNLPWTAQAQAANLTDGGVNPGSSISGENVGLTNLTIVPVTGNGFNGTATNFTTTANPAATPPVAPADPGYLGLGNEAHDFAQAQHGVGSVGLLGTLTLNAPSSTEAGQFTGTITFTLVGAIVANAH